jgi:hypothetical protein
MPELGVFVPEIGVVPELGVVPQSTCVVLLSWEISRAGALERRWRLCC